jgi:iron(III) transport system ATP-binding protein
MISIKINRLRKRFGATEALRGIDLTIDPGELFCLLGPSGGGKTTLLRCLAGLHVPEEGRIFFDEEDVTCLAPHRRNAGMVFQRYALWPQLTVAENVAFGLEERRVPRGEIKRRVTEALESVRMGEFAARRPAQLSGGQQQCVALARSLVVRPRCLLLDEPLSSLDAKLRGDLRTEIRRVCKESGITAVYVTHDQKEALSIADRLAILDGGRVLQTGTSQEIYRRPATLAVAGFIGETNLISGKTVAIKDGRVVVEADCGCFEGVCNGPADKFQPGAKVVLAIRPECWKLGRKAAGAPNSVCGKIDAVTYLGEVVQYDVIANGVRLKIIEMNPRPAGAAASGECAASAAPDDVVVLAE